MKRLMDVGLRPGKIIGCRWPSSTRWPTRVRLRGVTTGRARARARRAHDAANPRRRPPCSSALDQPPDASGPDSGSCSTRSPRSTARWAMRGCAASCRCSRSICTPSSCISRCARRSMPFRARAARRGCCSPRFPPSSTGSASLMVEAIMVPEGVAMHLARPADAAGRYPACGVAHKAHIVALSFSAAFPLRQATDGLATLRRQLPPHVTLWAGGEMTGRVRKTLPGVVLIPDLALDAQSRCGAGARTRAAAGLRDYSRAVSLKPHLRTVSLRACGSPYLRDPGRRRRAASCARRAAVAEGAAGMAVRGRPAVRLSCVPASCSRRSGSRSAGGWRAERPDDVELRLAATLAPVLATNSSASRRLRRR